MTAKGCGGLSAQAGVAGPGSSPPRPNGQFYLNRSTKQSIFALSAVVAQAVPAPPDFPGPYTYEPSHEVDSGLR
ncbi:MAG: hypothetical protein NT154_23470 [Verrucomicrobia bacterium]|nr:hypothetical protein [Verrucomicrobiota bacterium]